MLMFHFFIPVSQLSLIVLVEACLSSSLILI
jgi:hypothetical protein